MLRLAPEQHNLPSEQRVWQALTKMAGNGTRLPNGHGNPGFWL